MDSSRLQHALKNVNDLSPPPDAAIRLISWRPLRRNTLMGFASVSLPMVGLNIDDVAVHSFGDRRWASLPARPLIDNDGNVLRDDRGKIRYVALLRWAAPGLASEFGDKVVELVFKNHPGAFG